MEDRCYIAQIKLQTTICTAFTIAVVFKEIREGNTPLECISGLRSGRNGNASHSLVETQDCDQLESSVLGTGIQILCLKKMTTDPVHDRSLTGGVTMQSDSDQKVTNHLKVRSLVRYKSYSTVLFKHQVESSRQRREKLLEHHLPATPLDLGCLLFGIRSVNAERERRREREKEGENFAAQGSPGLDQYSSQKHHCLLLE